MAGGSGTRLWPLSREQYPKQFLKLLNERSLLQNTALRVARLE
ncbi:MAG: sugar phosphate nucleotidyltransferase, partial [Hydrocarboniphaga sp.]